MAVIITNMDMPKSCKECPFIYFRPFDRGIECLALRRNARLSRMTFFNNEKPERCPLTEVKDGSNN